MSTLSAEQKEQTPLERFEAACEAAERNRDWEIYNILMGLEAVGELLNPEVGISELDHPGVRAKLGCVVLPLAMAAKQRTLEAFNKLELQLQDIRDASHALRSPVAEQGGAIMNHSNGGHGMATLPSTLNHLNEFVELSLRDQKFDRPPKGLMLNFIASLESILVAAAQHEDAQSGLCILIEHAIDQVQALGHIMEASLPDSMPGEQEVQS